MPNIYDSKKQPGITNQRNNKQSTTKKIKNLTLSFKNFTIIIQPIWKPKDWSKVGVCVNWPNTKWSHISW